MAELAQWSEAKKVMKLVSELVFTVCILTVIGYLLRPLYYFRRFLSHKVFTNEIILSKGPSIYIFPAFLSVD